MNFIKSFGLKRRVASAKKALATIVEKVPGAGL